MTNRSSEQNPTMTQGLSSEQQIERLHQMLHEHWLPPPYPSMQKNWFMVLIVIMECTGIVLALLCGGILFLSLISLLMQPEYAYFDKRYVIWSTAGLVYIICVWIVVSRVLIRNAEEDFEELRRRLQALEQKAIELMDGPFEVRLFEKFDVLCQNIVECIKHCCHSRNKDQIESLGVQICKKEQKKILTALLGSALAIRHEALQKYRAEVPEHLLFSPFGFSARHIIAKDFLIKRRFH